MLTTHLIPSTEGTTYIRPSADKETHIQPLMKLETTKPRSTTSNSSRRSDRDISPRRSRHSEHQRGFQELTLVQGDKKRNWDKPIHDPPRHPVGSNHYYSKSRKPNSDDFNPAKRHRRRSRDSTRSPTPKRPKIKSVVLKVPSPIQGKTSPKTNPIHPHLQNQVNNATLEEIPPTPKPSSTSASKRELFPTSPPPPKSPQSPLIEMPNMEDFDETEEFKPEKNKSQLMFHLWSLIKHIDKDVSRELAMLLERKGYLNKN